MLSHIYTAGIPRMAARLSTLNAYILDYNRHTDIYVRIVPQRKKSDSTKIRRIYFSCHICHIRHIDICMPVPRCQFRNHGSHGYSHLRWRQLRRHQKGKRTQRGTTRAVEMLTHAALFHRGDAPDSLFTFPQGAAEYASPYPFLALRLSSARSLNYLFGRLNDCYRWCMEDMVEYGYKTEYLRYMSKCALMNGEYNLARRYLRMISGSMFHSGEAEKYLRYADNPELIGNDPEMASIKPLTAYDSQLGGDSGLIEHLHKF